MRKGRWLLGVRLLAATATLATLVGPAEPANGYATSQVNTNWLPAPSGFGRLFYTIDRSLTDNGFLAGTFHAADQSWWVEGLSGIVQLWNDPNQNTTRRLILEQVDGWGPAGADGTVACRNNTSTCWMRIETGFGQNWNTTTAVRDSSWDDLWGIAAHEFGHWMGLSHSADFPGTDNSQAPTVGFDRASLVSVRSIQADDASGMRVARMRSGDTITANGSFEFTPPSWGGVAGQAWGFRKVNNYGNVARYCPGGAAHGNCFIEFNGAGRSSGVSLYQDIANWHGGYQQPRELNAAVTLFSPTPGPFGNPARITVWAMNTTGGPQVVATAACAAFSWWSTCTTPRFRNPAGNTYLRVEIYNDLIGDNLRADAVRVNLF